MKKLGILLLSLLSNAAFAILPTPSLVAPVNGATNQDANELIDWGASTGQTYYELRYGTDPLLLSNFVTELPTTSSYNTSQLFWGQTYYWQVRAMSASDSSAWTSIYSFTVLNQLSHTAPADGATAQAVNVTIDWAAIGGFTFYDYQVDVTTAFNSPQLVEGSVTTSSQALTGLYFSSTYYWRVRVRHALDTSAWSNPWTFTTVNGEPTLLSPANGAVNQMVQLDLDWQAVSGQISYDYQADTSPSFNSSGLISGTSLSTSLTTISNLFYNTTYYWRIRTRTAVDTSGWSTVWSFTTTGTVTLLIPTIGSFDQDANETIDWTAISGTTFYDYQADTSNQFNSPLLISSSISGSSVVNLAELHFGETYYWRVRSRNTNDTSSWSATWYFTVRGALNLVAPANASINQNVNVTVDWDAIGGFTNYQYQADTVPTFNSGALETAYSGTSNAVTSELLFGKLYYWRVRTMHAQDTSDWSSVWTFTTLDQVVLVSPANLATGVSVNPNLDWNAVAGITGYHIIWDTDPLLTVPNMIVTGTTSQHNLSGLAYGETYYWSVRAYHTSDESNYAPTWSFTTAYQLTTAPILTAPADLSTNVPLSITLDWQSVSSATSYQFQVSESSTFTSLFASGTTSNLNANVSGLSNNTIYFWRVRANNGAGYSPWSTTWIFTTQAGSLSVAPLLQTPGDGANGIQLNAVLTWNPVSGATGYEYQIDQSAAFPSPQNGSTPALNTTISGLSYNTTYYWRVRATDGSGNSPWSTVWSFTTVIDPISVAPVLISPADLSVNIPLNTNFIWSAVSTAITYELQVDVSASFLSPISNNLSGVTTSVAGLLNSTTYYWRVRAGNGTVYSPWSSVYQFNTEGAVLTQAPSLVTPTDGSTGVSVNPIFDWSILNGAAQYELELDVSPSFSTPQVITTSLNYTAAGPLANAQQYYWRVRGVNLQGYSPYSSIWTFTTETSTSLSQPILLSPADLSTNVSINTSLSWASVSSATSYEVEYDLSPSFSAPVQQSIAVTSTASLALITATQYYWRVRASDGTTNSPWSQVWTFETELTTSTEAVAQLPFVMVYPNPADQYITLDAGLSKNPSVLFIYGSDGKLVLSKQIACKETLDCSSWTSGLYNLVFIQGDKKATQRLIVQ